MTCHRCDELEELEITTECGSICLCGFCGQSWWAMHLGRDELSEALNEHPTE